MRFVIDFSPHDHGYVIVDTARDAAVKVHEDINAAVWECALYNAHPEAKVLLDNELATLFRMGMNDYYAQAPSSDADNSAESELHDEAMTRWDAATATWRHHYPHPHEVGGLPPEEPFRALAMMAVEAWERSQIPV